MASTRSTLRSLLRTELKIDPNGKIWSDSTLNTYINRAYLQLQQDGNYDWQENDANNTYTPSGQETALTTAAPNFGKIVLVRYNGTELFSTSKIALKRQYTTFQSGTPSEYYIYGNTLGTDTITTSGTIDVDYKKIIAGFTDDADTSAYPTNFDTAIVKYAAYLAWASIKGNDQRAASKLQEYTLEKDTLVGSYIYNDNSELRFRTARPARFGTRVRDNVLDRF